MCRCFLDDWITLINLSASTQRTTNICWITVQKYSWDSIKYYRLLYYNLLKSQYIYIVTNLWIWRSVCRPPCSWGWRSTWARRRCWATGAPSRCWRNQKWSHPVPRECCTGCRTGRTRNWSSGSCAGWAFCWASTTRTTAARWGGTACVRTQSRDQTRRAGSAPPRPPGTRAWWPRPGSGPPQNWARTWGPGASCTAGTTTCSRAATRSTPLAISATGR